ncbi:zinc finger MYM-type protein 1 [Trichonephila clavipes]|nr:zinc finger MYM-type protein 1 [Trichonephila clavipes]
MQDYDDQQPSEKDIVQPEDTSSAPIEKCLENVGGQSFDNAANMSGRYNGVQTLLKEKNKFTNYAPCVAHSLNLVGVESVKVATEIVNFFGLMQHPRAPKGHGPACPPPVVHKRDAEVDDPGLREKRATRTVAEEGPTTRCLQQRRGGR